MSLSVILDPEAKTEYVEGYDYFQSRRTGLGDEFAEAVEFVLDRIRANPKLFRIVLSNFRCGVVQGFPYCVYYRVERSHIRVLSIFHTSQNPKIWQSRI